MALILYIFAIFIDFVIIESGASMMGVKHLEIRALGLEFESRQKEKKRNFPSIPVVNPNH